MEASPSPAPALVVLAAGMGSRYGGLKQLDPVGPGGQLVLDYSVCDARRAGFGKVVFVIRRDIEDAFRAQIGRRFEKGIEVRYAFQELDRLPVAPPSHAERQKPWGTGHAVWCAAPHLTAPFAVVNADDFYGRDAFQQLGAFLHAANRDARPATACMVGFRLANTLSEFGTVSRGLCVVDSDGWLSSIHELTGLERTANGIQVAGESTTPARSFEGDETVSMNCWGFTPGFIPLLEQRLVAFLERGPGPREEFYLPHAVGELVGTRALRVRVLPTTSQWFGVTYQQDRPRVVAAVHELTEAGVYPVSPNDSVARAALTPRS